MLKIQVPLLAPGLNGPKGLIRMHFATYAKVKDVWTWHLKKERHKAPDVCAITIERYYCSQPMDIDNLYSTCKIPLDAMKAAKIIVDDNPACVASLRCLQFKVKTRKEECTWILVEDGGNS